MRELFQSLVKSSVHQQDKDGGVCYRQGGVKCL